SILSSNEEKDIKYRFVKSTFSSNEELLNLWRKDNLYMTDSFQEDEILTAEVFAIYQYEEYIGYFALSYNTFGMEGFTVVKQFMLVERYKNQSKVIFEQILKDLEVESALVSTNDNLFLSLSMDYHTFIEKQAYVFRGNPFDGSVAETDMTSSRDNAGNMANSCIVEDTLTYEVTREDQLETINDRTGDNFDFCREEHKVGRYEIFEFKEQGEIVGYGILEDSFVSDDIRFLGNYVMADHRRNGYGKRILQTLEKHCIERNWVPMTGCNWYNEKSLRTITKAGFTPIGRLLMVHFTDRLEYR
ncbi:MAG TPA: GNAT family N-acetyltransferase, partial [Lachnospiraceae bacterium]|nr:GNAT family N-acetyltransferase [Lachnospiraceae bacterium]